MGDHSPTVSSEIRAVPVGYLRAGVIPFGFLLIHD